MPKQDKNTLLQKIPRKTNLPNDKEKNGLVRQQYDDSKIEFEQFKNAFSNGSCYICQKSIKTFSKNQPCLHWLLKPNRFKKKHFYDLAEKFNLHRIECYLRWVANLEKFAGNINDLPEEGTVNKMIELTIRYKNLEWSISCSNSDFTGHSSGKHQYPHYHFQMRTDGKQFIKFNDFHVPLHPLDIEVLKWVQSNPATNKRCFFFGEGVNDLISTIIKSDGKTLGQTNSVTDPNKAQLQLDTIVFADEDKTLSGDEIADAIQRAKDQNTPIASEIDTVKHAKTRTFISPADSVTKQAPRQPTRRGKGKTD